VPKSAVDSLSLMSIREAPVAPVGGGTADRSPTYLLPPEAYLSQAWFDREQDTLFAGGWNLVATTEQFAEAGDYLAVSVGRYPLVVVRDGDGSLHAFHNLCRHRGMVLVTGSGNVGSTINCFYHQWRYRLDGSLAVVPQRREQFPDMQIEEWGLIPASLEVWEGMVFVNPDAGARSLAEAMAGLADFMGSHRPGMLVEVASVQLDIRCNWKLFVENHVDIYHLWYLHKTTLGDLDHTRFSHQQTGGNWASYEPLRDPDPAAVALSEGITPIAHLDERDRRGVGAHLIFPNHMIASSASFFATYVAVPVAPDRTVLHLRIRAEAGTAPDVALAAARAFIDEDIHACEQVQMGMGSPRFTVGPLARDHELPVTRFQTSVLATMGPA